MCIGCWKVAGSPRIDNPKVRILAWLLNEVQQTYTGMGLLDTTVSEENLEDEYMDSQLDYIMKQTEVESVEDDSESFLAAFAVAAFMKGLTYEERYSAVAMHKEYYK